MKLVLKHPGAVCILSHLSLIVFMSNLCQLILGAKNFEDHLDFLRKVGATTSTSQSQDPSYT